MEISTDNFTAKELRCKCKLCNKQEAHKVSKDALEALQRVRERFDAPMSLTSAYRCSNHPEEAKKSKSGKHNEGIAFDVNVPWGRDRMRIVQLATEEGFKGFGFANSFLHLDYRTTPITSWTY